MPSKRPHITYRSRSKYDSDRDLKRLFNRINALWFKDRLDPATVVRWKRLGTAMGMCTDPDLPSKPWRIELDYSIRSLPRVIEWVLIHEMGHLAVGLRERAHHGPLWTREIKRLVHAGAYDSLF